MSRSHRFGHKMNGHLFGPGKGSWMDHPHARAGRKHGHRWVRASRDVRQGR